MHTHAQTLTPVSIFIKLAKMVRSSVVERFGTGYFGDKRKKKSTVPKTATDTVEEERTKRKDSESDPMKALQRMLLTVVSKVMKLDIATNFMYPVDRKVFPDYYDAVNTPMDLTSLKELIPTFKSKEDFMSTAVLISLNCAHYNDPESQIVSDAQVSFLASYVCCR